MLIRKTTLAAKTGRIAAATLGMLLWAGAQATPATDADSADAVPPPAARLVSFDELSRRSGDLARQSFGDAAVQSAELTAAAAARIRALAVRHGLAAGLAPGPGTPLDASPSDLLARLRCAFDGVPGVSRGQSERELALRNSDALARANVRMSLGREWLGFVYADVGAADSAVRWQGLAGIRNGHGVDLLGGWRHVTYHFSPGNGFDSLDFDGPFLGATLAW